MHYGRSLSAQAASRVVYILAGAGVFIMLARLMGPEDFGAFAWAATFLAVACALADLGMTPILARDLVATGTQREVWLANFLTLRLMLGVAVAPVVALAAAWLAADELRPVLWAAVLVLPLLAARFFDPIFQVIGRPWLALPMAVLYAVTSVAAALAGALSDDPVRMTILASIGAGTLYGAVGLAATLHLLRPDLRAVSLDGLRGVAQSVWPMALSSLMAALATRIDVFVIAEVGTDAMVGLYGAAYRFMDLGGAVIVTVLAPLLSVFAALKKEPGRLLQGFHGMLRLIASVSVACGILAIGLAGPVMILVFGADYASAGPALALLAWKFVLAFVNMTAFALVITCAPIGYSVWNMALSVVVTGGLTAVLVPHYGIAGAAIAAVAAEFGQLTVNVIMARRAEPRAIEVGWWARLLLATGAGLAVALLPWAGSGDLAGLVTATAGTLAFGAVLAMLRALPANPLPALAVTAPQGAVAPRPDAASLPAAPHTP
jgi:O-antigen/teichoic acid export membrane protein